MKRVASKTQLAVGLDYGPVSLVRLNADGEYGLYAPRSRNSFGTSLMARGTKDELERLVEERASR